MSVDPVILKRTGDELQKAFYAPSRLDFMAQSRMKVVYLGSEPFKRLFSVILIKWQ